MFPVFFAGGRSIGCMGSIVAFFCGVVCLSTCLTGWVNSFWLSLGSVTVFVVVVLVIVLVCVVAWDRGIGATVSVSRFILSIFRLLF